MKLWVKIYRVRSTPTPVGKTRDSCQTAWASSVHPHACGENANHRRQPIDIFGPPPRLWGKLSHMRLHLCNLRSTPTPVGKTSRQAVNGWIKDGPPPRLWGKRVGTPAANRSMRSTPTPVGKTRSSTLRFMGSPVHPHACGENTEPVELDAAADGPPPRLWGKPVGRGEFTLCQPVHPHACGENSCADSKRASAFGPPPRLWGKLRELVDEGALAPVHPHACGENPRGGCARCSPQRSTPTPVGKTLTPKERQVSIAGPPPRLWGKRRITTYIKVI